MNKYTIRRWTVLALGILANLSQGVTYSGSVFSKPVLEMVGIEDVKARWPLVFTLGCMFLPLGMILAGKLADRKGPRLPIAIGGVVFAAGLILASFATSYAFLCFTLGFMISLGSGLAYGPIVASAVRWFPDRRGLASGLVVGALGFGPFLIAPFCENMLNTYHFNITVVLQILGIISFLAIGAASFITSPPDDLAATLAKPSHAKTERKKEATAPPVAKPVDLNWARMIATSDFWALFCLYILGAMPGLMLISQARGIFESLGGFNSATAASLVGLLAAANAGGRILWGTISDYLGRLNTLIVMFACSAIAMFLLPAATQPVFLVAVILVIGTTYGGYLGLFPSFCADSFGLKNMSLNYAVLFIAFSVAAIAGPQIYGQLHNQTHAFFLAASLALLGGLGALAYRLKKKR